MKLKFKISLLNGLIVLVTAVSIIITAEIFISEGLEASTENEIYNNTETNAKLLKTKLDAQLAQLWEVANRIRTRAMDWDGVTRESLITDVDRIESLDIGLVFPDGTSHYVSDNSTAYLGDRDYIKQAFAGKSVASDVLISRVINKPVIMLASPVFKNAQASDPVVGVLIARRDAGSFLSDFLGQIDLKRKSGYSFLTNNEGTFTGHPNIELVLNQINPINEAQKDPSLKPLGDIVVKALKERSGSTTYLQDGKEMLCSFTEVPGYPWILFITMEKDEALSHLARIRMMLFITGTICTALGILIAVFAGRSITKPMISMASTMKNIGKGDLTHRTNISSKDEIGDLSNNFNSTLENIKKLILLIKNESQNLSGIGTKLVGNTNNTAAEVNQIAASIQNIKTRVINQSASVTETNATMEQINLSINKLNGYVERQSANVSQSSSAIEQMLANIQSVTQTLIKNTDNVKELMDASEIGRTGLQDVAADIQGIARESDGLLEINSVMENIASQTNLLSMNAAIEAAHAGDAGKGFAVVADEIRKLAENSSEQSKTISAVLKKIKESIDKIIKSTDDVLGKFEAIDNSVKTVYDQEENIRNAMEEQGEGSKQILEAISELNEITKQVKTGSEEMLEGSKEIITEGRNLEKATQEITGDMGEMAKSADQINITVNEVNDISGQNKAIIENLAKAVSRFKVE